MDTAFEKARAAYGTGAYDDATLEFLFPQLKESEDERIRRWIYNLIENLGVPADEEAEKELNEMQPRALAWLEKQKENPKSCDSIPSDCASDAKCEDRWHKVADSLPDNPREVLCKDEAGNYFIGRYYVGEGWDISNYDDEDKPHHLNPPVSKWIDFPSEKQKEQKPWKVGANAYFTTEQKPAEWSEEDEDMLNSCISSIEEAKENRYAYKETDGDTSYDHEIAWLKSLRPSWRPSEEQMNALLGAEGILRSLQYNDRAKILASLYEQLKQL